MAKKKTEKVDPMKWGTWPSQPNSWVINPARPKGDQSIARADTQEDCQVFINAHNCCIDAKDRQIASRDRKLEQQQKTIEEQTRRIESLEQGTALLMTARANDHDSLIKAEHERDELRLLVRELFARKGRDK
jgi:septal ring factor EnvC (AmiA/AmiB activator)